MSLDQSLLLGALGLLGSVELMSLGVTIYNARQVGEDSRARQVAREAQEQAQYAHTRVTSHLKDDHEQEVRHAHPDGGGGRGD